MILFGIVRALMAAFGGWLYGHGWIDPETHQRLISEGATRITGWVLMSIPLVWTVAQKWQVIGWVRTALHLDPKRYSVGDVPTAAPGPNVAI